jgi:hypothetical protein
MIRFFVLPFLGYLNDLWVYRLSNDTWTWMGGSSTRNVAGVFGIRGVSSPANYPGARVAANGWYDSIEKELWLFGGDGYSSTLSPGTSLSGKLTDRPAY